MITSKAAMILINTFTHQYDKAFLDDWQLIRLLYKHITNNISHLIPAAIIDFFIYFLLLLSYCLCVSFSVGYYGDHLLIYFL